MDLIDRKAAIEAMKKWATQPVIMKSRYFKSKGEAIVLDMMGIVKEQPIVPAVPLDKLCELLAEMYHCPSSGWPSSGHACHPDCTDEMLATICGMGCDHHSDSERWKAFLTAWMEGLNGTD